MIAKADMLTMPLENLCEEGFTYNQGYVKFSDRSLQRLEGMEDTFTTLADIEEATGKEVVAITFTNY